MELRETVEITTPATKKKVVLRGYITGRIKQEIEAIFLAESSFNASKPGEVQVGGSTALAAINKAVELIVMSVDGKTDGVLDAVLDLPEQDYDFVRAEVDKIQNPLVKGTSKS